MKCHREEGVPRKQGEEGYETSDELKHLYALIGSIASTWSHIENSVDVTLWSVAGLEAHVGACFTAQIQSLGYRLDALVALVQLEGGSQQLINAINQFRGATDRLARDRNRVVHDPISSNKGEEPTAITINARRTLKYGFFTGRTEESSRINREIAELLEQYLRLDQEIQSDELARRGNL